MRTAAVQCTNPHATYSNVVSSVYHHPRWNINHLLNLQIFLSSSPPPPPPLLDGVFSRSVFPSFFLCTPELRLRSLTKQQQTARSTFCVARCLLVSSSSVNEVLLKIKYTNVESECTRPWTQPRILQLDG